MAKQLDQYTAKELGQMAKCHGIRGWHDMCKKDLLSALTATGKPVDEIVNMVTSSSNSKTSASINSQTQAISSISSSGIATNTSSEKVSKEKKKSIKTNAEVEPQLSARQTAACASISFNEFGLTGSSVPVPGTPGALGFTPPSMLRKMTEKSSVMDLNSELAQKSKLDRHFSQQMKEREDKVELTVQDAFWIHVTWYVRQRTKDRFRAALGADWHYAKPAIRLFEVRPNDGFNSRRALRNIEIIPKAGNWFIDVDGIPASYQVELGYITEEGKFFTILTSNTITTPSADMVRGFEGELNIGSTVGSAEGVYEQTPNFHIHTSKEEAFHVREMIDDQRRKLGAAAFSKSAKRSRMQDFDDKGFPFDIDAKALIHGRTLPGAHVTVRGYPIIVDEDGEFLMRVELPDRRQIFPIVASSGDGLQQRTIVLSLERITRFLEPVYCMMDEEYTDY